MFRRTVALSIDVLLCVPFLGLGCCLIPDLAGVVVWVVFGAYFPLLEWRGGTVGQRVLGLHVVLPDGSPIGLREAYLRAAVRPFEAVLLLGPLGLWWWMKDVHTTTQTVGDRFAGTAVVRHGTLPKVPATRVWSWT
ncbi:MAG: RDD family protein, partial [Myxococcales bacterium]|nr:RDD family protein [Myxococcales bacterium]